MKLEELSLEELNIYRQNCYQTITKLERLLGSNFASLDTMNNLETRDFRLYTKIYEALEAEMNNRLLSLQIKF
jgi:hypothetical protein